MKKGYVILLTVLAILATTSAVFAANGGAPRGTTLSGSEVVPGPGDPDGSGFAMVRLNQGQGRVCWKITFEDVEDPTAAHIHQAPFGTNGGVVVPLSLGSGCADDVDQDLIKDIIQNPAGYYVQVHSAAFPGGALRGQLSNPGQSK
jgi:hypothetical protein